MTDAALPALRRLVDQAVDLALIVAAEQAWQRQSACAGWTVQDVFAHLAQMFHSMYAPADMPPDSGIAERNADLAVEAVRDWPAAAIVDHYRASSARGVAVLEKLQRHRPDQPVVMAELGRYPRHQLADAFVFDHFCHLAHDLLGPKRSFDLPEGYQPPEISAPVVGWMLAGLPQMCRAPLRETLDDPLLIELRGRACGRWLLRPDADGEGVAVAAATPQTPAAAYVRSADVEFTAWATRRTDWRESGVELAGDTALATRVLDAINIV